jgi:hypothetical protein
MLRRFIPGSRPRSGDEAGSTPKPTYKSGELVSVLTEDGRFGVMKILAVDDRGVHVRLYSQRFVGRPQVADTGNLSTLPVVPVQGNPFSFGHMPFSHASFRLWEPQSIRSEPVSEEELRGYRMWQKEKGGYF